MSFIQGVYRNSEFISTDHGLVIVILRIHFRCYRAPNQETLALEIKRLWGQACKSRFAVQVKNRFGALDGFHGTLKNILNRPFQSRL